ncbi:phenylacetate--CoA ligase family protein [Desulforhabdus amnigena]|uniref:Phenylacetate-coenzyme A ligase n=1 Tax=Desulforhabdus amnigena TaxID=40218 RepID=A0A9W6FVH8_9BACT|nr:phenylacetate--CoA ligase [Desulforhabdus amnigena]NLJ28925.1 phenylacetate--CoA ligase [Deltaproteobacteria bacterium]GLI35661.1 phenylacetate-coenzyme A ligase [Desulforhabdus amnigena]
MPIWEPDKECMSRDELEQLQLERLQATLNRVYRNVSFYHRRFKEIDFRPEDDLTELKDLQRLPFTTSQDVSDSYPYEMFAVPLREVVRVHSSSGTMTNPRVVGYTREDLKNWSALVARILSAGGVTEDDVIQVTFGYGLLTGGLGIHYGAERIGASVLPTSVGHTERQIKIMQDFRTTVLASTPSYSLVVADKLQEMGIDPKRLSLKYCICAGEPWTENMRREIEERLFVKVTDNYGISEVMGPGVAGECLEQRGMHIQEDHFYAETIDPETGEVLEPGKEGELVITTLTKEAFPVIRYRTGDLCRIIPDTCGCGRTFRRIGRILQRCDNVVVIKGINIIPERIGDVLEQIKGERPVYQLVATRHGHRDQLEIRVEITEQFFFDKMREQRALVEIMGQKVANFIGIHPSIKLVEKGSLERENGRVKLFVDLRNSATGEV